MPRRSDFPPNEPWIGGVAVVILACLGAGLSSCASSPKSDDSQSDAPADTAGPKEAVRWEPPEPNPKDFDWVRLKSDEWLKGDIKELYQDRFEFDSDEMDDQTFDWEDIKELRSPRMNSVLIDDRTRITGTVLMRDDVVYVRGEDKSYRFDRSRLSSIVPGEPTELQYWSGKISLGATVRAGNTNQTDVSTYAKIRRRTTSTRMDLDYTGNYGVLEGEQNANNQIATVKYDVFLSRDLYLTPIIFELYRDTFQNIQARLTPAAGMGYSLIHDATVEWDAGVYGGYRKTYFSTVEESAEPADSTAVIVGVTDLEVEVTKKVDVTFGFSIASAVPEIAEYNARSQVMLSVEITRILDLDVTFQWDRVGQPVPDASGQRPEKDDFRLTVGFGLDF